MQVRRSIALRYENVVVEDFQPCGWAYDGVGQVVRTLGWRLQNGERSGALRVCLDLCSFAIFCF